MNATSEQNREIKLKPMKCELNYLSRSDGSAILSQGETVALVSINGPQDIKIPNQSIERATLEALFMSKSGKPCIGDRYKENIIRQTCEAAVLSSLHPRTGITITVQEIEDSGGILACIINAVCLALINSGLAMRYMFAAVTCSIDDSGNILLDMPGKDAQAMLTFVFDSLDRNLIMCVMDGKCSEVAYNEALERCRTASDVVFDFYKDIVTRYSKIIA